MDNKKLREKMFEDVKKMDDTEFMDAVKHLNTYSNIKHFSGKKVDMEKFFKMCIVELIKRKQRVPSGGYFDLIEFVDSRGKKK